MVVRVLRGLVRRDAPVSADHMKWILEKTYDSNPTVRYVCIWPYLAFSLFLNHIAVRAKRCSESYAKHQASNILSDPSRLVPRAE
jgi:hypothetical protein